MDRAGTIATTCHHRREFSVIEMLFRLGFALLLSVGLALLLAWGWSSSDERTAVVTDAPQPSAVSPAPLR